MPLVVAGAGQLRFLAFSLLLSLATVPTLAQLDPQTKQLSRDIFQQLIEINTTDSVGSTTVAANAMAQALARRWICERGRGRPRTQRSQRQHGGAHSWHGHR